MSSDAAPAAEAAEPAIARAPRFTPKRLIVGGAAALAMLLLLGGAAWWLWPAADTPPVAKARPARKAAATAASAAAAAPAPVVHASASAPVAPAADPAASAAAHSPVAQDEVAPVATHGAASSAAPAIAETEAPLERLQRRLGEVLGPKGAVKSARSGEWRLVTRASVMAAPAHDAATRILAAEPIAPGHAASSHAQKSPHWAYEGRGGPQAWGRLKPEFGTCASGKRQSPIDIRDGLALELEPVQFDYRPSSFGVIDTGHTVQVNVAPGNGVDIDGRRFELLQFHFHRPSEERINGRQFDMVVHLVHKDAEGRLAVVAVLLERGAAQPLLQTVWNHLPLEKGEEAPARATLDLRDLLPEARGYYTYMGSLTTPPCSEGVRWVVMQQPVQVSGAQIDIFSRLYPMNARPIQQAAGRLIKQSQ